MTKNISCLFSTSAASFLGIRILLFCVLQPDAVLSNGRMNADARVKKLLGHSALHSDADALSDFSSVGRANMEADDFIVVCLINKNLYIAVALRPGLVIGPLQWLEFSMVG